MNIVKCEKCGAEMQPINPTSYSGMTCPKCGWGWATSPYDALAEDDNDYVITLLENNNITKEALKTLSDITGQNYIKTKNMIDQAPIMLCTGKAKQVDVIIKKLSSKSILFDVNPQYPYL